MPQTITAPTFASALTRTAEPQAAVRELLDHLSQRVAAPVDMLCLFVTPEHRDALPQTIAALREGLAPRTTVGLTAQGVIGVRKELEEGPGMTAIAATLPGATLRPFTYQQLDWPAVAQDVEALRRNIAGDDATPPKLILLLADPFSAPMGNLLPAMTRAFPGVPIAGGMASAARQPGQNRLILDDQVFRDGAVGLLIGGDIDVRTVVSQGCRPIGKPFVITRSQRHLVQELGGRPAIQQVQEMAQALSDADRELIRTTPLLVGRVINEYKHRFGRGDFLIRNVMGIDPDKGFIAIADPQVRVGQTIQFHLRDARTAREDFELLLEGQKLHDPPAGAILFSCNGRGTHLFNQPDADATMIADALGDVPLAGFFAGGEIGPVGDQNFLHGHTASMVVFRAQGPD